MRLVMDTNVLLSALLWRGTPHALLEQVRNEVVTLISSPALLKELAEVLERPKFDAMLAKSGTSKADLFAKLRLLAEVIDPPPLAQSVCRDPDDDEMQTLTRISMADLIVSGDDDLLALLTFEGIPIMTPAQAMERLQASH